MSPTTLEKCYYSPFTKLIKNLHSIGCNLDVKMDGVGVDNYEYVYASLSKPEQPK